MYKFHDKYDKPVVKKSFYVHVDLLLTKPWSICLFRAEKDLDLLKNMIYSNVRVDKIQQNCPLGFGLDVETRETSTLFNFNVENQNNYDINDFRTWVQDFEYGWDYTDKTKCWWMYKGFSLQRKMYKEPNIVLKYVNNKFEKVFTRLNFQQKDEKEFITKIQKKKKRNKKKKKNKQKKKKKNNQNKKKMVNLVEKFQL